jgi:pyrroloquinoline quinone biosynthesis protein D
VIMADEGIAAALSLADRPQLRRGVRAGIDPLSGDKVLLFPEGVLFLNETAAAVIQECDGSRSVTEVVQAIGEVYDNVALEDVITLLQELITQHLLVAHRG